MYSPCLSAIVGVQPLSAPTRHCLGRPLPYQLADRTQAHPSARSYSLSSRELIKDYPRFRGAILNQRVDSYVLLTRPRLSRRIDGTVPFACLRHAASVHPEPGSNSQIHSTPFNSAQYLTLSLPNVSKEFSYHTLIVKVLLLPKSPAKRG